MAEHFKLILSNKRTMIETFTGVDADFDKKYFQNLHKNDMDVKDDDSVDDDVETAPSPSIDDPAFFDGMSDAMKAVFGYYFIGPHYDKANPPIGIIQKQEERSKELEDKKKRKRKTIDDSENSAVGKYKLYNYHKTMKRRSKEFRSLAYINFRIPNVKFVTLTFDPRIFQNASDLNTCNKAFVKFIKRIRYYYNDFIYLAVFSRQDNGNWHYHMLCNFDMDVKNKTIQDIWNHGMVESTSITSNSEFSTKIAYCTDNMRQCAMSDLQCKKGYLPAKGLQREVEISSWTNRNTAYELLSQIIESSNKPLPIDSRILRAARHTDDTLSDFTQNAAFENDNDDNEAVKINRLISYHTFDEYFTNPPVAIKKKK